jgi:PD-(D/E)XK nuclease superfamily
MWRFEKLERRPGKTLSATVLGTVVHHALHAFERAMADGGKDWADAKEIALATFDFYWDPRNLSQVYEPRPGENETVIDVWINRDSYGSCRQRGLDTVTKYAELWLLDDHRLLGLEHPFEVPVIGTEHTISGFVDRFMERKIKRVNVLDFDDWKTGKRQYHLRQNLQLTVYAYASTRVEFWLPFQEFGIDPEQMMARYDGWARHVNWYDLQAFKLCDAGYRGTQDYHRLAYAVDEVAKSIEAGIFPLNIGGDTCTFCPHNGYCPDGSGIPADDHGDLNVRQ